jgi:predicted metalloprotease with PDZ domain
MASKASSQGDQTAPVSYQVALADLKAHLFRITLTVQKPSALQRVSLPVWIPGSYLLREFSKNLQSLSARQGSRSCALAQTDKCTWEITCTAGKPLRLVYEVYARDASVRAAWLDSSRGFFNGPCLLLRVEGCTHTTHELELIPSKVPAASRWSAATALTPKKITKNGFGTYSASNYEALVDAPVELGEFWSGTFIACGVLHRFVVSGMSATFDAQRLIADTQKICETQIQFWHGNIAPGRSTGKPPFKNYLFMLHATDEGYGGLEHRNSTALICGRKDLPRIKPVSLTSADFKPTEGYNTLLGLISHEYFHTWNVKRLRPAEYKNYDYAQENYTQMLWFFEGFTSYFDDLLLRRAHLIDDVIYLKLLGKTINQVHQTPGRTIQTLAQASFDAWVKYYRQDENTPNATVSYYTKGALVALCLDLTLRIEGTGSLDDTMRALWKRCDGGPMSEEDLLAVLQAQSGRSYVQELSRWVHGTGELPVRDLLERHGVSIQDEQSQIAQQLGLRVTEGVNLQIKTVLRQGLAEAAGFAADDEWLGIEVGKGARQTGWRISHLDDLMLYAGAHSEVKALVSRDKRLHRLTLKLPRASTTWRLTVRDEKLVKTWLGG